MNQIYTEDSVELIADEYELISALLPLQGATVLELGCGDAAMSRRIAADAEVEAVLALDVDEIQLQRNLASEAPARLTFARGGAQDIAQDSERFDIVMMLKSLHHVPVPDMARAMREIRRVLRPGGLLYVSEPVFADEFNEVMRLFHDEQAVREAAIAAMDAAIAEGLFDRVEQRHFVAPVRFADFADFERRMMQPTHSVLNVTPEAREATRARFEANMSADGVLFHRPMRVDLLRRHA